MRLLFLYRHVNLPNILFATSQVRDDDKSMMDYLLYFIDVMLHLDVHLVKLTLYFGLWTYLILFLIIFAETGLVVTPFLPGDSLLFAVGAVITLEGSELSLPLMFVLLVVAGVLGNTVNYAIGKWLGPKVFERKSTWLLNKQHLLKTQKFYDKHGALTIIVTRFMPIVRTFSPFVAGVARMNYTRFLVYNIIGAVLWVGIFLVAGYMFGNIPEVKRNFHIVIFGIIIVSMLPMVFTWLKARAEQKKLKTS
ncbi:MAG: DedA family protein [Bdellovibrionales bacterium]